MKSTAYPTRWQHEYEAVPAMVSRARRGVADFARALGVSDDALGAMTLAVSEAATNAVMHAFVDLPPGSVSVIAEAGDRCVIVWVIDNGRGMIPRTDSPGLGQGLRLVASLSSSCDIREGRSGRGTEVRMAFAASA